MHDPNAPIKASPGPRALKPILFDPWGDGAVLAMFLVSLTGAAMRRGKSRPE